MDSGSVADPSASQISGIFIGLLQRKACTGLRIRASGLSRRSSHRFSLSRKLVNFKQALIFNASNTGDTAAGRQLTWNRRVQIALEAAQGKIVIYV